MANNNRAVFGIVKSRAQAERIVDELRSAGFPVEDISVLYADQSGQATSANLEASRNWRTEERITDMPAGTVRREEYRSGVSPATTSGAEKGGLGHEKHTKAPEGATTGATTGGIIGGVLGLLAGIGALAIPGMGPFIAAGPIMGALSGLGVGGTLGGIVGGLIGLGIPEYEAKRYENRLKEGGILVSVLAHNSDQASRLEDIFKRHGAEDISTSSETSTSWNKKK